MKRIVTTLISICSLTLSFAQAGNTYFVSADGNDSSDGLSIKTAWRSLEKVSNTIFCPGDKILFRSGQVWNGQLTLNGTGTPDKPIVISSFGGEKKPVINTGSAEGAGILLKNQGGWEISNLEITSGAPPELGKTRQGIYVLIDEPGVKAEHIVIENCYIHDIWGQLGGVRERSSAILVSCRNRSRSSVEAADAPSLNNVRIERNRIERVDKTGIVTDNVTNGLLVRKNYMNNLGGDGIIVGGSYRALVEFNEIHRSCLRSGYLDLPGDDGWWPHTAACWLIRCEETIMQFNEVYDTGREPGNGDGFAYDFDFYCKRCIAQYNYSRNNHGFLLLMYDIFENVARYNISENDQTHLVQMQGSLADDRNILYNNVFYVDHGTLDLDFFRGDFEESAKDINQLGAMFRNNIFYATGQGRFRTVYSLGETMVRSFDESVKPNLPSGSIFLNNCYYGPWKNGLPDDPKAIVADPKFVAPGTGGFGLDSTSGYRLQDDSPCINAGMYIPFNGGRDFFGNAVDDGHPDIGAFEALGTGVFADCSSEAEKDKDARDASELAWAKWSFPLGVSTNNPEETTIVLYEPLSDKIEGSISWNDPSTSKTVTIDLGKAKDRQNFTMKLKASAEDLMSCPLKVEIRKGKFTETFEIPFSNNPETRK